MKVKSVEHRARCKFCNSPPMYYTYIHGTPYYVPSSHGSTIGRANKFKADWSRRPQRDKKEYPNEKLMRWNVIRGGSSLNPWFFKKNRDNWGGIRILLSCRCGESTWMFTDSYDADITNRQLKLLFEKFPLRYDLEDINVGSF